MPIWLAVSISKLDGTLLEECSDRSREGLRIVNLHVTFEFRCLALGEAIAVGNVHRSHDAFDTLGPHAGDPLGDLAGFEEYVSARHYLIYRAELVGFRCGDLASRQREFDRLGAAEIVDKPLRVSPTGHRASRSFGNSEQGTLPATRI